ncbi:uncharacterized protein EI90DRAFT_3118990 [Cantharellus anzutake]|uniref:uncharacterized protein n=1 Tax=Cantharellus anzutake TaxID=1750568 RepID=UPI00190873C9|nr:uncharacterized protein EI90DRAFT_3118990 [Cantharellus anzutake]KAF8337546.1 hypothetical protein EI90DRAFT_3118990 [Cantharellus anzutake]
MSASSTPGPSNQDPTVLNLEVLLNLLQQQMVQHQDLMTAIQAQQQDQQTLMNMVQMQLQNVMPAPAPVPVVVTTSNPTIKFPNPTAFTGKPSGVRVTAMHSSPLAAHPDAARAHSHYTSAPLHLADSPTATPTFPP